MAAVEQSHQVHMEFRNELPHQVAESRLMQYAFGGEVADYDVEGNE